VFFAITSYSINVLYSTYLHTHTANAALLLSCRRRC
jgi:hypothetical protein